MPVDVIVADFESAEGVSSSDNTVLQTHRESSMINGTYATCQYKMQTISKYVRMMLKKILSVFSKDLVSRRQLKQREQNEEYIPLNIFLTNHHG